MASVTSIVPSGITMISEWKFSMRSSRVRRAEAAGMRKLQITMGNRSERRTEQRTRVMRCTAPASCRWRAETDLGSFALRGGGNFEEFARLESQHVGKDI